MFQRQWVILYTKINNILHTKTTWGFSVKILLLYFYIDTYLSRLRRGDYTHSAYNWRGYVCRNTRKKKKFPKGSTSPDMVQSLCTLYSFSVLAWKSATSRKTFKTFSPLWTVGDVRKFRSTFLPDTSRQWRDFNEMQSLNNISRIIKILKRFLDVNAHNNKFY